MIVCKFYELDCVGVGGCYTCAWFGAPSMHSMSGLSLAWHWHVGWGYVH